MLTRILPILGLVLLAIVSSAPAHADLAIVSALNGQITELSRAQAERLYLGRTATLPDNTPVTLLDLPPGATRDSFYFRLTGKNPVQTRAYWSRQVFTGRALPPREANSVEQLREWLVLEPSAIGYLPFEAVNARTRVLLRLRE